MKPFLIKLAILLLTATLLSGCYEDYLIVTSNFKSVVLSNDSSTVFFFHFLKAEQPPKGMNRLPDGGSYNSVYKNVKLYSYQIESGELRSIHDFGNVPFHQIFEHIAVQNDNIVFSLSPLMGWNWIKNHQPDTAYKRIVNDYSGFYQYNLTDNKLNRFVNKGFYPHLSPDNKQIVFLKRDSVQLSLWHLNFFRDINQKLQSLDIDGPYIPAIWKDSTSIYYKVKDDIFLLNLNEKSSQKVELEIDFYPNQFPSSKIKKMTSKFTYQQWGFNLRRHFHKSNQEYINDLVLLNGNFNYRKAIIETLSEELSDEEVHDILNQIMEYQNTLKGYKKAEYEINSKETKDELKKLLN